MWCEDLTKTACFGVAGNFTGHLEQAGEAKDFANVHSVDKNEPKALFPTYLPSSQNKNDDKTFPDFLTVFPFDDAKIIFPENEQKIQLEPECGIIFTVEWKNGKAEKITPICFGASNDCSIRKEGAKKISMKKNWGESSKGLSKNLISLDSFSRKSLIADYRIASFLQRGDEIFDYGEDSAVNDYNYCYEKLSEWIIKKLNFQVDEGPAENINSYMAVCDYPEKIFVSIGATRYTKWGETNFLHEGDFAIVVLYPNTKYKNNEIKEMLKAKNYKNKDISFLVQKIVVKK